MIYYQRTISLDGTWGITSQPSKWLSQLLSTLDFLLNWQAKVHPLHIPQLPCVPAGVAPPGHYPCLFDILWHSWRGRLRWRGLNLFYQSGDISFRLFHNILAATQDFQFNHDWSEARQTKLKNILYVLPSYDSYKDQILIASTVSKLFLFLKKCHIWYTAITLKHSVTLYSCEFYKIE